ncbi:MAG: hypothetical protein IKW01_04625 [Firmicutes bacterium]|nr:hypothetical protein [Bacillota bacterium]
MRKRRRGNKIFSGGIFVPLIILAALLFFMTAVSNLDDGRQEQAVANLEEAVRRASVACYAAEGIYPPDLEYLEEHYGIQINKEKYVVHYMISGSNFMPDITVIKKDW